jgi:hypothetical protein
MRAAHPNMKSAMRLPPAGQTYRSTISDGVIAAAAAPRVPRVHWRQAVARSGGGGAAARREGGRRAPARCRAGSWRWPGALLGSLKPHWTPWRRVGRVGWRRVVLGLRAGGRQRPGAHGVQGSSFRFGVLIASTMRWAAPAGALSPAPGFRWAFSQAPRCRPRPTRRPPPALPAPALAADAAACRPTHHSWVVHCYQARHPPNAQGAAGRGAAAGPWAPRPRAPPSRLLCQPAALQGRAGPARQTNASVFAASAGGARRARVARRGARGSTAGRGARAARRPAASAAAQSSRHGGPRARAALPPRRKHFGGGAARASARAPRRRRRCCFAAGPRAVRPAGPGGAGRARPVRASILKLRSSRPRAARGAAPRRRSSRPARRAT